jgi:uncharacterized membrane protein
VGDKLSRAELDEVLFGRGNRQQLVELVSSANPHLIAGVITKALELQILTEEVARSHNVDISDEALAVFNDKNHAYIAGQLDRALNAFISSIVSQES